MKKYLRELAHNPMKSYGSEGANLLVSVQPDHFIGEDNVFPEIHNCVRSNVLLDPPLQFNHVRHYFFVLNTVGPEGIVPHQQLVTRVYSWPKIIRLS